MSAPLTDAQLAAAFDATFGPSPVLVQAEQSIAEAKESLAAVRDWSHREFVSDSDLFAAPPALLAAVPDCQRVRNVETARACLAFAEEALPALRLAVEEGAKVGATGARKLRPSAEVAEANDRIAEALGEVSMGAIFARHICIDMANAYWSDCVDLS